MTDKSKFVAVKQYGFLLNYTLLFDLYAPIIGRHSVDFYVQLYNEAQKQQNIGRTFSHVLKDFLESCNLTNDSFSNIRQKLEAIGLLSTYVKQDIKTNDAIYYFLINQPLEFHDFINNQKYRHLLIRNIGQINYEKLEYIYGNNHIPSDVNNISSTFEMVFNDQEVNQIQSFNFHQLYQMISASTSLPIVMSEEAKQVIETYYKTYDFTINEIQRCVYDSIIKNDNSRDQFLVDVDLLKVQLNNLTIKNKNIQVFDNIKINRNIKMFIEHLQPNQLQLIFNDYLILNAEQFLNAITKQPLNEYEKQTINLLRKNYHLSDYVINLIVDYSLFKTNGKLNQKYLKKVAQTINNLNLKSLQEIYDYFHYMTAVNQLAKDTNQVSSSSLKSNSLKTEKID